MTKKRSTHIKATLLVISCGGTIAGKRHVDSFVEPFEHTDIIKKHLASQANIQFISLFNMLSEDMNHLHWAAIAKCVEKEISRNRYKAIIVLHGTFTLSFTASALSFMMQDLPIPLIMTGSVFTPYDNGTDVFRNLDASLIAADKLAELPGVYVVSPLIDEPVYSYFTKASNVIPPHEEPLTYCIFRGINLRKMHSWQISCFQSINTNAIAMFRNDEFTFTAGAITKSARQSVHMKADSRLDPRVCCIKVFPGFDPSTILHLLAYYKAFIIEGYADGTLPNYQDYSFLGVIRILQKQCIPVFITSQPSGITTLTAYQGGVELRKLGAIPLFGMTTETALVKLMWVLGQTKRFEKVNRLMQTNIVGEIDHALFSQQ